jgi:tetratricopeptide (TPR) repeat protein
MSLDHLSQLLTSRGRHDEALAAMSESMELMLQLGATDDYADLLCRRADSRARRGDAEGARADYTRVITLARRTGMPETRASGYVGLSALTRRDGDLATARALATRALAECPGGSFSAAIVRAAASIALAWTALAAGSPGEARPHLRDAAATAAQWHDSTILATILECLAGTALLDSHPDEAALLLGAATATRGTDTTDHPDATAVAARARAALGSAYEGRYRAGRELTPQKALTAAGITTLAPDLRRSSDSPDSHYASGRGGA